jgi:hypothetical protein
VPGSILPHDSRYTKIANMMKCGSLPPDDSKRLD